jgi:hypothetical protein
MSATSVETVRVAICPYACEVFVYHGLLCRDTASRVVNEECVQQVKTNVVEGGNNGCDICAAPLGEGRLEVGERCDAGPLLLARCTENTTTCQRVSVMLSDAERTGRS